MQPRYFVLEFRPRHGTAGSQELECRWRRLSDEDSPAPWSPVAVSDALLAACNDLRWWDPAHDPSDLLCKLESLITLPSAPGDAAPMTPSRRPGIVLVHAAGGAKDIHAVILEALFCFQSGQLGLMQVLAPTPAPVAPALPRRRPLRIMLLLTSLESCSDRTAAVTVDAVVDIHREIQRSVYATSIQLLVAASQTVVTGRPGRQTLATDTANIRVDQAFGNADGLQRLLRYGLVDGDSHHQQPYDALVTFGHSDANRLENRKPTGFEFEFVAPGGEHAKAVIPGETLASWIGFPLKLAALINCGSRTLAEPFLQHTPHVLAAHPIDLPVTAGATIAKGLGDILAGNCTIAEGVRQTRHRLGAAGWMLTHLATEAGDPSFATAAEIALKAFYDHAYQNERRMVVRGASKTLELQRVHIELGLEEDGGGFSGPAVRVFEDLLQQQHRRWILRGGPGSGKSWTLRFCAVSHWPGARLVLFEALHHIHELAPRTGPELAEHFTRRTGGDMDPAARQHFVRLVEARAKSGDLVILLDAYDELDDSSRLADLIGWFERNWPDAVVVVSCRTATEIVHDRQWRTASLLPLDTVQQRSLLQRLFHERAETDDRRAGAVDLATNAVKHLQRGGPRMQEIAGSPMMLASIGELILRRLQAGDNPDVAWLPRLARNALLREIVTAHLEGRWADSTRRPARRTAGNARRQDRVRRLLAAVAWQMTERHQLRVPATEVGKLLFGQGSPFARFGPAEQTEMQTRIGRDIALFCPEDDSPGAPWSFVHRQLLEALAAEHWWGSVGKTPDQAPQAVLATVERAVHASPARAVEFLTEPVALVAEKMTAPGDLLAPLLRSDQTRSMGYRVLQALDISQPKTLPALFQTLHGCTELSWSARAPIYDLIAQLPESLDLIADLDHWIATWSERERTGNGHLPRCELAAIDACLWPGARSSNRRVRVAATAARERILSAFGETDTAKIKALMEVPGKELSYWAEIPAGWFAFGVAPTARTLELRNGFGIARVPVTLALFQKFAPTHGNSWPAGPTHPVTDVTWPEAVLFCRWLRHRLRLPVRLPTEIEFEAVARGVVADRHQAVQRQSEPWGRDRNGVALTDAGLPGVAWFGNPKSTPRPVASLDPKEHGVFDMLGNTWHWCATRWSREVPDSASTDAAQLARLGLGDDADHIRDAIVGDPAPTREKRVIRGGSFRNPKEYCSASARFGYEPSAHYATDLRSFRLILDHQEA